MEEKWNIRHQLVSLVFPLMILFLLPKNPLFFVTRKQSWDTKNDFGIIFLEKFTPLILKKMIDTSQLFNCSLFNGIYLLFIFAILLMPSEAGNKITSRNKPWKYFSLFKIWLLTLPFKNYPNKQTVREIQGVQRNMTVGEWFWMSFSIYYIRY